MRTFALIDFLGDEKSEELSMRTPLSSVLIRNKEAIMKQGLITLLLLFTFATHGSAQEVNRVWLDLLFPEVRLYMDSMDARIGQLETQLTELREDYIRYQNLQNLAIKYISLASVRFSQAGIHYATQDEQSYHDALNEGDGFLARAMEADVLSVLYEEKLGLLNEMSLSRVLLEGTVVPKTRQLPQ